MAEHRIPQPRRYRFLNYAAPQTLAATIVSVFTFFLPFTLTSSVPLAIVLALFLGLTLSVFIFLSYLQKTRKSPMEDILKDGYMLDYDNHQLLPKTGVCSTVCVCTHKIDRYQRAVKIFFAASETAADDAGTKLERMQNWDTQKVVRFFTVAKIAYSPLKNLLYKILVIPIDEFQLILERVALENNTEITVSRWSTTPAEHTIYLTLKHMVNSMEENLSELRNQNIREKVGYAIKIARAVEHVHTKQEIHRNIKFSNILNKDDAGVVISEPGIANFHQYDVGLFFSPEQEGNGQVTLSSDIYSLGLVLAFLCTSHDENDFSNFIRTIKANRREITDNREMYQIPEDIAKLVYSMLDEEPRNRPISAVVRERLVNIAGRIPQE